MGPWLLGEDFNEILSNEEKIGGRLRLEQHMSSFREVLDHCQLKDLKFIGNLFTWNNGQEREHHICEHLDRFLANTELEQQSQYRRVQHGFAAYFDHLPIILLTT